MMENLEITTKNENKKSLLREPTTFKSWKFQFDFLLHEIDCIPRKSELVNCQNENHNGFDFHDFERSNWLSIACNENSDSKGIPEDLRICSVQCDFGLINSGDRNESIAVHYLCTSAPVPPSNTFDSLALMEHLNPTSSKNRPEANRISTSRRATFTSCTERPSLDPDSLDRGELSRCSSSDQLEVRELRRRLNSLLLAKQAELAAAAAAEAEPLRAEVEELARFAGILDAAARTDLRSIESEVDGLERVLSSIVQSAVDDGGDDSARASSGARLGESGEHDSDGWSWRTAGLGADSRVLHDPSAAPSGAGVSAPRKQGAASVAPVRRAPVARTGPGSVDSAQGTAGGDRPPRCANRPVVPGPSPRGASVRLGRCFSRPARRRRAEERRAGVSASVHTRIPFRLFRRRPSPSESGPKEQPGMTRMARLERTRTRMATV